MLKNQIAAVVPLLLESTLYY